MVKLSLLCWKYLKCNGDINLRVSFLLDAYGVDYMDLLTADSSFVRDIGAQDSYFGELSLGYTLNEKIKRLASWGMRPKLSLSIITHRVALISIQRK